MNGWGEKEYDGCGAVACKGTLRQHYDYRTHKRLITCDKCGRQFEEGRPPRINREAEGGGARRS